MGAAGAGHGLLPTLSTLIVALLPSLARSAAHDPSPTLRILHRSLSRQRSTARNTILLIPALAPSVHISTSPLPSTTAMPGDQGDHHATKPTPHCKQLLRCSWTASPPPKGCFTPPLAQRKHSPCEALHCQHWLHFASRRRPFPKKSGSKHHVLANTGVRSLQAATIAIYGNRFNCQSSPVLHSRPARINQLFTCPSH